MDVYLQPQVTQNFGGHVQQGSATPFTPVSPPTGMCWSNTTQPVPPTAFNPITQWQGVNRQQTSCNLPDNGFNHMLQSNTNALQSTQQMAGNISLYKTR